MAEWNIGKSVIKTRGFAMFILAATALAGFYSLVFSGPNASQQTPFLVVSLPVIAFVALIGAVKKFSFGEIYHVWRASIVGTLILFIGFVGIIGAFGIERMSNIRGNLPLTVFLVLIETTITVTVLITVSVIIKKSNQWMSS